jgi:hypothetical protein
MSDSVRTAAIMQPTYLPWMGYFDLIDQVDVFVFLDSVQFDRRSWQQRNRVKGPTGVHWLTVPVHSKGKRDQKISNVEIDLSQAVGKKHSTTIRSFYLKSEYFTAHFNDLAEILARDYLSLADLNITLITWFCERFGIQAEMVRSSDLASSGKKAGLLADICKEIGASRYLSPEGSRNYIEEDNAFDRRDVELVYQAYAPSEYRQLHGDFEPSLSALDLLLNEGPRSLDFIRGGSRNP